MMTRKATVRTAVASAMIAPVLVFAAPAATAAPVLSAGATGEVSVSVPAGESWNCFGFDSSFNFRAGAFGMGLGKLGGFAKGNVTVFCLGTTAPFFFTGTVAVK